MNLRDQGRLIRWNTKTRTQPPRTKRLFESLHKLINSFSGARGYRDTPRKTLGVRLRQFAIRQIVNLIENTRCLLGNTKLRVVGSSVAKSLSSATRSAPVSRFSSVDFPALV